MCKVFFVASLIEKLQKINMGKKGKLIKISTIKTTIYFSFLYLFLKQNFYMNYAFIRQSTRFKLPD